MDIALCINFTLFVMLSSFLNKGIIATDVCLPDQYNESVTGTDLFCFDCAESYAKTYDPYNSPCKNNLSQIALRQCGPRDKYCKVERLSNHRQIRALERGCVETCYHGCRFNGFGLTYMKCTTCCRTPGCNEGNGVPSSHDGTLFVLFMLPLIYSILHLYSYNSV